MREGWTLYCSIAARKWPVDVKIALYCLASNRAATLFPSL
jgi:hypothetical protein